MDSLPFDVHASEFVELVGNNRVVVLSATTGAGKSTKAPLALLRAGLSGDHQIIVTQPRRPGAINLAKWVATLHGSPVGQIVGYHIGMDRTSDRRTKLLYATEGIVLNRMRSDAELRDSSVLVLDEMHERGFNQDLLLALVKHLLARRLDVRVVIMSATIDTDRFSQYFDNAPILHIKGRQFPVEIRYAREMPEDRDVLTRTSEKILEILRGNEGGDILAFLPDYDSIAKVQKNLSDEAHARLLSGVRVLPLYGQQPDEEQQKVYVRDDRRRIILSTNLAETSVTIDGVVHVVDSGLIKQMCMASVAMSALQVTAHSKAGCDQRAGRAGRTQSGICHRIYTAEDYEARPAFTSPEITRMNLTQVLLDLRCMGFALSEILELDFLDRPSDELWEEAARRLTVLGALDADDEVTEAGRRMQKLHIDPMLAKMILEGQERGCLDPVLTIAAALSATKQLFVRPPDDKKKEALAAQAPFKVAGSDPLTFLKVWLAWDETRGDRRWAREHFVSSSALTQMDRLRQQFLRSLEREPNFTRTTSTDTTLIGKCVAAGLIVNVARKSGRFSYSWSDQTVYVHPGSVCFGEDPPAVLVCASVVVSGREGKEKPYMRACHAIDPIWVDELYPRAVIEAQRRARWSELDRNAQETYDLEIARRLMESLERERADEEKRTPLRARYEELSRELADLGVALTRSYDYTSEYHTRISLQDAVRARSWVPLDRATQLLDQFERIVESYRRRSEPKFEATGAIYTQVSSLMPACPVCGGAWNKDNTCEEVHDLNRLIPIPGKPKDRWLIGRFLTGHGQQVASLHFLNGQLFIRFVVDRERPWNGKAIKQVSYVADQAILPPELMENRQVIIDLLGELEAKRQAVAKIQKEIEEASKALTEGSVAILTFYKDRDGLMYARHGGITYRAPYADLYPNLGECWLCQVGKKKHMMRELVPDATLLHKIESPVNMEDINAFKRDVEELFNGKLPVELLSTN